MKTAIITCIDEKVKSNFKNDFIKTLRESAKYDGDVFLLYYGKDKSFVKEIKQKYNVNVICDKRKKDLNTVNQRIIDLPGVIENLPKNITNIMYIDGGDVWFQGDINEAFFITKDGYGFVQEDDTADKNFNLHCINKLSNQEIKSAVLNEVKDKKLINGGLLVGKRQILVKLLKKIAKFVIESGDDFFAEDQVFLNYVLRKDDKGLALEDKYNYIILNKKNNFFVKNGLFFDISGYMPSIIHNAGNNFRMLPEGRKSIKPVPKNPGNFPGSFWGITTFFNPAGYKNKIKNYHIFRENSKRQGLKLLTVELAFGNKKFELKNNDADILIQLRTNDILWHKERMINVGLSHLPKDCDKFAWLDCDIIFLNENWIKQTSDLLQEYSIIQPFSDHIRLSRGKKNIKNPEKILFSQEADVENKKTYGLACRVSQLGPDILEKPVDYYGQSGLAWAARRDVFEDLGLLDKSPLPILDSFMANLFYRNKFNEQCEYFSSKAMKESFLQWAEKIKIKSKNSVHFTHGTVLHLWHGKMENRNYRECARIAKEYDFDPNKDIGIDESGCLKWTSSKLKMHKDVADYFIKRQEGNMFKDKYFVRKQIFIIKENLNNILLKIDRNLGKVGVLIKSKNPKIYYFLKKQERKLRNYFLQIKINKIIKNNWNDYKKDLFPKDRRMKVIEDNKIIGLNTENVRFIINEIVRIFAKNGFYFEVGVFQGASFLGAGIFNDLTRCIGIDDFSEFDEYKQNENTFYKNLSKLKNLKNIEFYKGDYKDVIEKIFTKEPNLKIDVYFYDGNHSYKDQIAGLRCILPYLARQCIIIVDDINWDQVRKANDDFLKENPDFVSLFKIKTKGDRSPDWWNGLQIMGRGF